LLRGRDGAVYREAVGALRWLVVTGLALLPAASAGAQGREVPIEAGHRIFVAEYVAAVNARDAERFRRLVHPKSLACVSDANRDFYDAWVARAFRHTLPDTYRLTSVKALPPNTPPIVPPGMAIDPVPPTHQIQIDVQTAPYRFVVILLQVTRSAGAWLQVMPCPTAEGLAAFRAAKQKGAARDARVKALAAALADPLRAEILALVKAGKKIDAVKHYQAASGEDLTTAKSVVEALDPDGG
jgi:hypothetical protein